MAVALGLFAAFGLALVFPYRSLDERIARDAGRSTAMGETQEVHVPGDPLRLTYMQLWLRARPQDDALRMRLARELADAGDIAGARAQLKLLAATPDPDFAGQVALLDVDLLAGQAYRLAPSDPRRAQLLAEVRETLDELALQAWPIRIVIELADRAATHGARDAAATWHRQMLESRVPLSANAWEIAARRMVAIGELPLAAQIYMHARHEARSFGERRRLFIAALQALQAGNQLESALQLGEAELGELANDTVTLEFLTRLALAANRPDIAQRFATRLLRLSLRPPPAPPRIVLVQAPSIDELRELERQRQPHLPFNDRIYQLSYEVYLANGNLRDALAVARSAVRQAPNMVAWRRRLAQVAEWAGQPELALEQWHVIARSTNDEAAWRDVARLAAGLFDDGRMLEVLQRQMRASVARGRPEFDTLRRIVELHERLGQPERAIGLLREQQSQWRGPERRRLLMLLADLAERTGRDDLLRTTLATVTREFGTDTDVATRLAELHLNYDRAAPAFEALRAAAPRARDNDAGFWHLYAEAARLAGRDAEAVAAWRKLIASGNARQEHYTSLTAALEEQQPMEAAAVAEAAFDRFGTEYLALHAMSLRQKAGDLGGLRRWLARLRPEQHAALESSALFLYQRAAYRLAVSDPRGAADDLRTALARQPDNLEFRQLLVWSLIAARDRQALRAVLRESARVARREPALWAPFGAAWLSLAEPRQALPYLQAQLRDGNPLLWLGYADALEQMGDRERAWQLRRAAWAALTQPQARAGVPESERAEFDARLVSLAQLFEPADAARRRLFALLKSSPRPPSALTRETALGYWIGREHAELTRAWLLQRYVSADLALDPAGNVASSLASEASVGARVEARGDVHGDARDGATHPASSAADPGLEPVWARLSVALAEHDLEELDRLLDTMADWLPVADRIEAAQRTGRAGLAQTLAFDRLELLPDNDDLHRRFTESTLRAPSNVFFGATTLRQRPLHETGWQAGALVALSPRLRIGAATHAVERHSTDEAQLVGVPGVDRLHVLSLQTELAGNGQWRLSAFARDGLASVAGMSLQADRDVTPRWRLGVRAGFNETATDSAYLRVGGVRDVVALQAYGKVSQREFVAAGIELNHFAAQGGGDIGRGTVLRLEAGHWLRFEYPDLAVRAMVTDLDYSARDGLDARLATLLPAGLAAGASNATFLPRSTMQLGVGLSCGETARSTTPRAWRPWCSATLLHDRENGGNYEWAIGALGSVLGTDVLELSVGRGSSRAANASPYTQFMLHYRWLF